MSIILLLDSKQFLKYLILKDHETSTLNFATSKGSIDLSNSALILNFFCGSEIVGSAPPVLS